MLSNTNWDSSNRLKLFSFPGKQPVRKGAKGSAASPCSLAQEDLIFKSPAFHPPSPLPAPSPPHPLLQASSTSVPSSYRFPSGQKNSVINPPLRLISKDQHWPRSHLARHHQNSMCRRCWEENLTETGFRMSGRLLSTCQVPVFQKEVFMRLTWWLEDVFIKKHARVRLVDPAVPPCIAEQEGQGWFPGLAALTQRQEQGRRWLLRAWSWGWEGKDIPLLWDGGLLGGWRRHVKYQMNSALDRGPWGHVERKDLHVRVDVR